jgi:hypothetical protein
LLPNVAAVSSDGRELAEMLEDTETRWPRLALFSSSVNYSCLQSMVKNIKHYIILGKWLVAFDQQLDTYDCLDCYILAFVRATVPGYCWRGLDSVDQTTKSKQRNSGWQQSIIALTFRVETILGRHCIDIGSR